MSEWSRDIPQRPVNGELLWVSENGEPSSHAHDLPVQRRSINSHVQRFQKSSPQLVRNRKPRQEMAIFSKWRLNDSVTSGALSKPTNAVVQTDKSSNPRKWKEKTECDTAVHQPRHAASRMPLVMPLKLIRPICLPGKSMDPFGATAAKIEPSAQELLYYYTHVLVPSKWYVDSKSKAKLSRVEAASMNVIQGCFASELHLYSLLASMSSRMQNLEHWKDAPPPEIFIQKALGALRRYLQNSPEKIETQVFHDMFFLCTAEAYRYDLAASMTHLRAIAQLVEVVGGLNKLDNHMLLETLVQGDIMLAVEQLAHPIFPLTWDPGPFPAHRWERLQVSAPLRKLGQAFLRLPDDLLPQPFRALIQCAVQCMQVAQHVWTDPISRRSDLEWVFLRYLAIVHRLLRLEFAGWQTEALRIAVIMWLMIVMTSLGIRRAVKLIIPSLKQALLEAETEEQGWNESSGVQLWIVTVGSIGSEGLEDGPWFISRFALLVDRLQIRTGDELWEFLRSYFVLEPVQSPYVEGLIDKLGIIGTLAESAPPSPPSDVQLEP